MTLTSNAPRSAVACTEPAKRSALIYARVSKDMSGVQRSPNEQVAECRAICERNGWDVRDVIIDNNLSASAFARKQRPGYRRVMTEIQPGEILVVWEPSRITRKMDDHQDLVNLCKANGILFCAGGEVTDFTNPSDELNAGMKAQWAQFESAQTKDRVRRNTKSRAEAGRPHGNLGFGYRRVVAANGTTLSWEVDPVASVIVERVAEQLLGGRSLYGVAADLNADGSRAPGRKKDAAESQPWTPEKVKAMILRPALAGLRVFQGDVIGDNATWPAILTPEQHERLKATLTHTQRTKTGPKSDHLSSGIAMCAKCDEPTYWQPHGGRKGSPPQYRCPRGCVQRNADVVDDYLTAAVLDFFGDKVRAQSAIFGNDGKLKQAAVDLVTLQQEMQSLMDEVDALGFTRVNALREKKKIEDEFLAKIKKAEEVVRTVTDDSAFRKFHNRNDPQSVWESLTILERRATLRALLEKVAIQPIRGRKDVVEHGISIRLREFPTAARDTDDYDEYTDPPRGHTERP